MILGVLTRTLDCEFVVMLVRAAGCKEPRSLSDSSEAVTNLGQVGMGEGQGKEKQPNRQPHLKVQQHLSEKGRRRSLETIATLHSTS